MEAPRIESDDVAMDLILWGRSRDSLPPLTEKRWQRVAASLYRNCLMAESRQLNPMAASTDPTEVWYRSHSVRWTRLICGALTARAQTQGWDELARQWGSRYWARTKRVDLDQDLKPALAHVIDIEDAVRAAIADSPKR